MNSDSRAQIASTKQRYRNWARNLPLTERLRQLESLQEQTYDILRVRELNGGPPIPRAWQLWALAQERRLIQK
jgi:hypothetical protein